MSFVIKYAETTVFTDSGPAFRVDGAKLKRAMSHVEHPSGGQMAEARRPCVLLASGPPLPGADEHWSKEWIVVDHPWVALAEVLLQDRVARARAGWGLPAIGRSYIFVRGQLGKSIAAAFDLAMKRFAPDAVVVQLNDSATIAQIEQEFKIAFSRSHPLRRSHASIADTQGLKGNDSRDSEPNRSSGSGAPVHKPDLGNPIPFQQSPPSAWNRADSMPGFSRPSQRLTLQPEVEDATSRDVTRDSITSEEISLLLERIDEDTDSNVTEDSRP